MSKIEKLKKNKTIDYSNNKIEYFIQEYNNSKLVCYDEIISKIEHSKKKIQIASTSVISNKIIDSIYQINDINIYIILKSFQNTQPTLGKFGEKKPAILREVNELDNNFIIIDDISYLFINPLENKENIIISFDENKTKDLSYIFNYYFWDCASQEKLIDTISTSIESPFPPVGTRELDGINIVTTELDNCVKLFIPRDKKFINELDKNSDDKYFSDDIKSCVYQSNDHLQIGNLIFQDDIFELQNRWSLKNSCLNNISIKDDIVPKQNDWNDIINIQKSKVIKLSQIEAKTIEDMNKTEPSEFKGESYIKSITYAWEVIPPSRPKEAKKSSLYNQYDKLDNTFKEQLSLLNNTLIDLEKESGLLSFFGGTNRKAKQNINKTKEYKQKNLKDLSHIDLKDFINKEFKSFYEDIINSNKDFKDDKKKQEAKDRWENEKEQKTKSLEKKQNELSENKNKLTALINSSENKKTKEQTKLEKFINNISNNIDLISKEIEDKYSNFKYNPKENEIKNFNKNKSNSNHYKALSIPKYTLPEVGVLFETKDSYYLEIVDLEDLNKANELSQRYKDKQKYKVVAGDNDE